jgi:hypothetical protein
MRQEIEIVITADGEVKLKVHGAAGPECLELTRALEEELGLVVEREKTSEFYQASTTVADTVKIGED